MREGQHEFEVGAAAFLAGEAGAIIRKLVVGASTFDQLVEVEASEPAATLALAIDLQLHVALANGAERPAPWLPCCRVLIHVPTRRPAAHSIGLRCKSILWKRRSSGTQPRKMIRVFISPLYKLFRQDVIQGLRDLFRAHRASAGIERCEAGWNCILTRFLAVLSIIRMPV